MIQKLLYFTKSLESLEFSIDKLLKKSYEYIASAENDHIIMTLSGIPYGLNRTVDVHYPYPRSMESRGRAPMGLEIYDPWEEYS